ncbi:MAG: ThiF family adenylyltransferase [Candidatus Thermoplasmatota archaeon]|jgi:adenylyltransferase/sulfurtransferase|nr:ThiF family adenylyltransferase [Candidatus Thermoplasmatota archaeon]
MEKDLDRYRRQLILKDIGMDGQMRLLDSKVTVIGCGATGSVIANALARSGVGHLTVVDRDVVEPDNLQRQLLFDEDDIGCAKAAAAGERLKVINSSIEVSSFVEDVGPGNIAPITKGSDLIMDATDNMATRFLMNELSVREGIPWIYTGVVETMGMSMNIVPGKTACLRCALPAIPAAGTLPTCSTVGIINTIPSLMGSIAATEAIKLLLGKGWSSDMVVYDVWKGFFDRFPVKRRVDCECCVEHKFDLLDGKGWGGASRLCGSDAVQITSPHDQFPSLKDLSRRLRAVGEVEDHGEFLRVRAEGYELVIFKGGRTIVHGTSDELVARSLYSKYVGN